MNKQYDFYYSAKQRDVMLQTSNIVIGNRTLLPHILQFNGKLFTEAVPSGTGKKCNWDDAVLIGTGTYKEGVTVNGRPYSNHPLQGN